MVRRLSPPTDVIHLLDKYVVWDCPDMTMWAANNYVPRLLEVAGLADVRASRAAVVHRSASSSA